MNSFLSSFSSNLEEPVRQHLKNVYCCLTLSSFAATAGAYVHIYTEVLQTGLLSALSNVSIIFAAVVLLIALYATPHSDKNIQTRVAFLFAFAFLLGIALGPLLKLAIIINPSIIVTTLVGSTLIFTSFSIASLTAKRGQWLYLGATLMTMLISLTISSLANIFFGSQLIFEANLYIGLLVMFGYVLYDTQLIVERRRCGDRDFVAHSLDLFIDFFGIFWRILIILADNEKRRTERTPESSEKNYEQEIQINDGE